jgi:hypothetical protein
VSNVTSFFSLGIPGLSWAGGFNASDAVTAVQLGVAATGFNADTDTMTASVADTQLNFTLILYYLSDPVAQFNSVLQAATEAALLTAAGATLPASVSLNYVGAAVMDAATAAASDAAAYGRRRHRRALRSATTSNALEALSVQYSMTGFGTNSAAAGTAAAALSAQLDLDVSTLQSTLISAFAASNVALDSIGGTAPLLTAQVLFALIADDVLDGTRFNAALAAAVSSGTLASAINATLSATLVPAAFVAPQVLTAATLILPPVPPAPPVPPLPPPWPPVGNGLPAPTVSPPGPDTGADRNAQLGLGLGLGLGLPLVLTLVALIVFLSLRALTEPEGAAAAASQAKRRGDGGAAAAPAGAEAATPRGGDAAATTEATRRKMPPTTMGV